MLYSCIKELAMYENLHDRFDPRERVLQSVEKLFSSFQLSTFNFHAREWWGPPIALSRKEW